MEEKQASQEMQTKLEQADLESQTTRKSLEDIQIQFTQVEEKNKLLQSENKKAATEHKNELQKSLKKQKDLEASLEKAKTGQVD